MTNCRIRFMDNLKIDNNYTVSNEDSSYPFTNALSDIRSRIFKAASNDDWRITLDLGFPDKINSLILFAPLGQTLGITREATIKLQADNVNDFTNPELSIDVSITSDDRLIFFPDEDLYDLNYRFWSLFIDDPTNTDIISFAYIYIGDYTSTELRNVDNGFAWETVDPSRTSKSLNGTAYFNENIKYDKFNSLKFNLINDSDRRLVENIYDRFGKTRFLPVAIDPTGITVGGDVNTLTRLTRFSGNFKRSHKAKDRYDLLSGLEEVI